MLRLPLSIALWLSKRPSLLVAAPLNRVLAYATYDPSPSTTCEDLSLGAYSNKTISEDECPAAVFFRGRTHDRHDDQIWRENRSVRVIANAPYFPNSAFADPSALEGDRLW